jgi:hypothetical protein
MRVADAVVDILKSEGVKFVAALPGDDILPLFDAVPSAKWYPVNSHAPRTGHRLHGRRLRPQLRRAGRGDGDEGAGAM